MTRAASEAVRFVYLVAPLIPASFAAISSVAISLRALGLKVYVSSEQEPTDVFSAIERDLDAIEKADALVLFDGWSLSPASRNEVTFAEGLGKPLLSPEQALRLAPAA